MNASIINSFGLVLDIAGAVILWLYPIPVISRIGDAHGFDTPEDDALRRHIRKSRVGLGFMVVGFLLQLACSFG